MPPDNTPQRNVLYAKVAAALVIASVGGTFYFLVLRDISFVQLAGQEQQLREFQKQNPVAVYAIAFAIYVAVTGLSLPGAGVMSLVFGWYFGLLRGVILVSFASTTGATIAFLLSRYLFRDAVQARFGARLATFNQNLQREGAFYLFTLRLIAGVPFFVINIVMGLTPMKVTTFWWVSQIGMIPGTIVYIYAGSSVPSLQTFAEANNPLNAVFTPQQMIQIGVALALLGLFPLLVKTGMKTIKNMKDAGSPESESKESA